MLVTRHISFVLCCWIWKQQNIFMFVLYLFWLIYFQSAIFNFQSLLTVVLLLICTCAYIRSIAPSLLDRNKQGYSIPSFYSEWICCHMADCSLMPRVPCKLFEYMITQFNCQIIWRIYQHNTCMWKHYITCLYIHTLIWKCNVQFCVHNLNYDLNVSSL